MAELVSALVAEVVAQGSFDASNTDVLKWLNRRHKEMVNHARAYRDSIALGTTVVAQQEYPVPAGVVELKEVTVNGVTWSRGRHTDISANASGWLWLDGPGGIIIESVSAASVTTLALVPVPTTAGQLIVGYGVVQPPDLLLNDTVPILVDDDLVEGLLAGVFATGFGRPGQGQGGDASAQAAVFDGAKQEFKWRVKRRLRGSGPATMRLAG